MGWVAQRLHGLLGDPALICFAAEGLHLSRLLADLMEWTLHCIVQDLPLSAFHDITPQRLAAATIERHGRRLHQSLGCLVGSLEHALRAQLT